MKPGTIYQSSDGIFYIVTGAGEALRLVSRDDARRMGLPRYFTGRCCRNGKEAERLTASGACTCEACRADAREKSRDYNLKNAEAVKERRAAFRAANKERVREQQRRWYQKKDRGATQSARRSRKAHATPAWADPAAIAAVFAEAARLEAETGIKHNVDHIVPINSPHVCGLHVPWNLRAIPESENKSKRNRLTRADGVDYFDCCLSEKG